PFASAAYCIDPPQAPFPTCRNLPFQSAMGSQTSDLISESEVGAIVISTRQKAGRAAATGGAIVPVGGLKRPAATGFADVIVVFGRSSESANRSQAAGLTVPS